MEVCDKLMVSSPDFAKKVDHIRDTFQLFNNLEAQKKLIHKSHGSVLREK